MTDTTAVPPLRTPTGEPVILDTVLARAGEGTVYTVAHRPDLAAKIFHPTLDDLPAKVDKVAAMVQSPPPGRLQPNGFVVLTWPTAVILDGNRPVGFTMPRIDTATSVEIHTMANPSNRHDPLPGAPQWTRHATWEHLVNTAANLCLAVQVVHRVDAVIGDFQERNILVSDTTEVTLVDCDSMQFTDSAGHRFLCGVGRPEFTAPELAGMDLRAHPREKPSDLFALAIHIFQLLMAGNHPFLRGIWTGSGPQPDALTLARSGSWAGAPGSPLQTHPLAPPVSFLPTHIQRLFSRAFSDAVSNPVYRPSAQEWRDSLLQIRLMRCARHTHDIPVTTVTCPWCVIDDERAARRQQSGGRSTDTGPKPVPGYGGTGPQRLPAPRRDPTIRRRTRKPDPAINPKIVLAGLIAVVVTVVALAAFVVWAVLSGASTFGAG